MNRIDRMNRNEMDLEDETHMSNDEHSDRDDEIRDCDSPEENGNNLNSSNLTSTSAGMEYGNNSGHRGHTPELNSELSLNHHSQFPPNHPLGALGNFMGLGLHNIPNLQHGDVLEKLKMQVRDMKGLLDQDYAAHPNFPASLPTPPNTAFSLPPNALSNFGHTPHNLSQSSHQAQTSHSNGFSFASSNLTKDGNPGSNSSTSSETSNDQQNNGWSFEEQYKQVRQLYEINDDPKRKEFLDDLFSFMQKRGTPINRLPIMAKSVLDLYELYNLVIARGGLVDVINKKLWQEIIKGLHLPSSITSAAFTLRTQYMKYLYPYECEKKNLSSPSELQAAIDGNRREGRRTSYGQFEAMHNQLQMPQMQRNGVPNQMSQMSPLALVTHAQNQSAAAAAAVAHRLMPPPLGQMPNLVTHELEQHMMQYLKLFQNQQKEPRRPLSPDLSPKDALNALELSRVALWQMYNNNTSPPSSVNTSPQGGGGPPQNEALNLSESPPNISIKRERPSDLSTQDEINQLNPLKKQRISNSNNDIQKKSSPNNYQIDEDDEDRIIENINESHKNNKNTSMNLVNGHHNLGKDDKSIIEHSHHHKRHSRSPLSSPSKENHHHHHHLHNGDLYRNEELPIITGMQFKLTRKGNGVNGEQQLVINLDLNGIHYEGVLFANPISVPPPAISITAASSPPPSDAPLLNSSPNTSGSSSVQSNPINIPTPTTPTTTATVTNNSNSSSNSNSSISSNRSSGSVKELPLTDSTPCSTAPQPIVTS